MSLMVSQITSLTIVYSAVYSGADQRKHQRSASLAFVRGIHRGPVNSPHKWPVTRKMFPFDDVIMWNQETTIWGGFIGLLMICEHRRTSVNENFRKFQFTIHVLAIKITESRRGQIRQFVMIRFDKIDIAYDIFMKTDIDFELVYVEPESVIRFCLFTTTWRQDSNLVMV